jgi:hypothetical protein
MSIPDNATIGCVFSVVGQHRDDPSRMLLFGDDGCFYQLDPLDADPVPVEPDGDWIIESRVTGM